MLILAPPMIAANGRSGLLTSAPEVVDLLLHQEARHGGQVRPPRPTVEACARWAVPKASLT